MEAEALCYFSGLLCGSLLLSDGDYHYFKKGVEEMERGESGHSVRPYWSIVEAECVSGSGRHETRTFGSLPDDGWMGSK